MPRSDWKRPKEFSAPEGRRRVALEISYDGRAFCGWQSQNNGVSVQEEIKKGVEKLTGQKNIEVCGSGRTDSGVHAMGQVAHVEMDDCSIPATAFCNGLNCFIPPQVRIIRAWDVEPSFHARYSAMAREYRYFFKEHYGKDSFSQGLITNIKSFPDKGLLDEYAKVVLGTHDFTTFTGSGDQSPSKVRDIYESEFFFVQSVYGEKVLCYRICGNAFLYHMVRSIAGTMIQMASRGRSAEEFRAVLESRDRSLCGKTAPSDGLYLWRISYDENEYMWFEEKAAKDGKN